ncbi:hypothetical protein [Paenibacillus tyrfis]|uniref:hypothetical protein n=1 Tax=Paenibacillus tyrfis TaxID=1501230 RepID=UPI00117F2ED4|nr:hypothetical protein [Paenibacillus tyrfis]
MIKSKISKVFLLRLMSNTSFRALRICVALLTLLLMISCSTHTEVQNAKDNSIKSTDDVRNSKSVMALPSEEQRVKQVDNDGKNEDSSLLSVPDSAAQKNPTLIENASTTSEYKAESIILGRYSIDNPHVQKYAEAIITQVDSKTYNIDLNTVIGESRNKGKLSGKFIIDSGVIKFLDSKYADVSLKFNDNKLIVSYPDKYKFGEPYAEPLGTYYLTETSSTSTDGFLDNLFKSIKSDKQLEHNVKVIADNGTQLILVETLGADDKTIIKSDLVIYDKQKNFNHLGATLPERWDQLKEQLKTYDFWNDAINYALKNQYINRYFSIYLESSDAGNKRTAARGNNWLTDQECFYVVTGIAGKTKYEINNPEGRDGGSILIYEIEKSTKEAVVVHAYEESIEGQSLKTLDRFKVDRITGNVKSQYEK